MPETNPFRSILLILSLCTLFSAACSKNKDDDNNANWMRLKKLSSVDEVRKAVGSVFSSYAPSSSTDTRLEFWGNYPDGEYSYHYDVVVTKLINASITDLRAVRGRGNMGDDSKSGRLNQMFAFEINNGELGSGKYSNVVAIGFAYNSKANWRYELFIDLNHINKEDQLISIEGGHHANLTPSEEAAAPPVPTEEEAIAIMLQLIEQGKE